MEKALMVPALAAICVSMAYADISGRAAFDRTAADRAADGWVCEVSIPWHFPSNRVDWLFNPTKAKPPFNPEWTWQLNRTGMWAQFAEAYRATGDEKYARAFARQARDWLDQTGGVPPETGYNAVGSPWRTIEEGIRLMGPWSTAYAAFKDSPSFPPELRTRFLESMRAQAKHLMVHRTTHNWLLMEMNGVYTFACNFPQFPESAGMRRESADVLSKAIAAQVLPDGLHDELSPDYHLVFYICASAMHELAKRTGFAHELPESFLKTLELGAEGPLKMMTPGFVQPRFNDCYTIRTKRVLETASRIFPRRRDFLWAATEGRAGEPPPGETASRYLPYAGFAVMRSGWDREAAYLAFDVGPLGANHWHQDKLSFTLWKGGEELVFDDGGGQYENSDFRRYGLSGADHNTLLVDGLAQNRCAPLVVKEPIDARWSSTPARDFARGVYDQGFGPDQRKLAVQVREIAFEKPELFRITDTVRSADGREHDYEILFHLDTTNVMVAADGRSLVARYGRKWDLSLTVEEGGTIAVQSGVLKPRLAGWFVGRNDLTLHKATTVSVRAARAKDARFVTVLRPVPAADARLAQAPAERHWPLKDDLRETGGDCPFRECDGRKTTNDDLFYDLAPGMSFSARLKFDRLPSTGSGVAVLSKGDVGTRGGFLLRLDSADEGNRLSFFVNFGGTPEPRVSTSGPIKPGVWYDVAAGWDGRDIWLTVNGETRRTARPGKPMGCAAPLTIGDFNGSICDLRFRNGSAETSSAADDELSSALRLFCSVRFERPPTGETQILGKDREYLLRYDRAGNRAGAQDAFCFYVYLNGNWEPRVVCPVAAETGRVYHVAASWDGLTARLQVDGCAAQQTRRGDAKPNVATKLSLPDARSSVRVESLRVDNRRYPLPELREVRSRELLPRVGAPFTLQAELANCGSAATNAVLVVRPEAGVRVTPSRVDLGDFAAGAVKPLVFAVEGATNLAFGADFTVLSGSERLMTVHRSVALMPAQDPDRSSWQPPVTPTKTHYLDAISGDDGADGLTPQTAWRSCARARGLVLGPGERLLLRRGSVFRDELVVTARGASANWAEIGAYGEGPRPTVRRSRNLSERCVHIVDPSYLVVRDLVVCDAGKGLDIACTRGGCRGILVERCLAHHIEGLYRRNSHGIPEWRDLAGAPGAGSTSGIGVAGSRFRDVTLRDCESYQCSSGFRANGGDVWLSRMYCHDNFCPNTSPHPYLTDTTRAWLVDSVFDASGWQASAGTMGIMLAYNDGLVIRGCHFLNQPDSKSHDEGGIDFEAAGANVLVDACTFRNNAGAAIEVLGLRTPQVRNVHIRGSRFDGDNVAKKLGPSEIYVWGGTTDRRVVCSNGLVEDNGFVLRPGVSFYTNCAAATRADWTLRGNRAFASRDELNRAMPLNDPPAVEAGEEIWTDARTVALRGRATDDGLPRNRLTTTWEQLEGPGLVRFADAATTNAAVTFPYAGDYRLLLKADDGQLWRSGRTAVHVLPTGSRVAKAWTFARNLDAEGWQALGLGTTKEHLRAEDTFWDSFAEPVNLVGGDYYTFALKNASAAELVSADGLNLELKPGVVDTFVVKMNNHTSAARMKLIVELDASTETRTFEMTPNDTEDRVTAVPLPSTGTVRRLRLVFADDGRPVTGTCRVDYIWVGSLGTAGTAGAVEWTDGADPAAVSAKLADQLLSTAPEHYQPKGYRGYVYERGGKWVNYAVWSLWANALANARLTGDADRERRLVALFEPFYGAKRKVLSAWRHVDFTVQGALPLEIARLTGDPRALKLGLEYADVQWAPPRENDPKPPYNATPLAERQKWFAQGYTDQTRFWIDDMYMISFLQSQAYLATGDRRYVDRAARELVLYLKRLQRPNGLFHHAEDVPYVWGRGCGWMAVAMPMLLKYLPSDSKFRPEILAAYRRTMATLLSHQRPSGLWGQLVDDAESWDETSASAMFAYAFNEGAKHGWIDAGVYGPAARRAYLALVAKLDEFGNVPDVCTGTGAQNSREYYLARERVHGDPHGQAALSWLCRSLLETEDARPKVAALRPPLHWWDVLPGEPELVNRPADGFRGIWYMNQPSGDEFVYKYSGGMGVYCAGHVPMAVYSKETDRTYFCYGGTDEGNSTLYHCVSYYDHRTKKLARPRVVIDKHTIDAHDNAVISLDEKGHIWLFSASHGVWRPSCVSRSVRPHDITEFEIVRTGNFSYPQPYWIDGKGFLFIETLYQKGNGARSNSFQTYDAATGRWSEPECFAFIELGDYVRSWRASNGKVGLVFDRHPAGKGLNWRTDLYYMETDDLGRTWKNAAGEILKLPIVTRENPALVRRYAEQGLNVYIKGVRFDRENRPVVLYVVSKGYESGPKNNPRAWKVARWNGRDWEETDTGIRGDNNYDFGVMIPGDGDWRVIAAAGKGPQPWNPGGELQVWASSDVGRTWRFERALTANSPRNMNYPRTPLNAAPGFCAMWADGDGRAVSESRLYFCDADLNAWEMPRKFDGDFADPVPYRAASGEARCERTPHGVKAVRKGRTLWEFSSGGGKPCVHPLAVPDGTVITDSNNSDHPWHRGLWFSWKFLNGVNYWEVDAYGRSAGEQRVVAEDVDIEGASATVRMDVAWGPRAEPERVLLDEKREIAFSAPGADGGYAITWKAKFTARERTTIDRTPPVRNPKTGAWSAGYAGFSLRLADFARGYGLTSSSGAVRQDEVMERERGWIDYSSPQTGEGVRLEILKAPGRRVFYHWPDHRFTNLSPVYDGPIVLEKGETLELAYRATVHAAGSAGSDKGDH